MDEQTERIRRINHRGANTSNYNFFGFDLLHIALESKKVQFVALFDINKKRNSDEMMITFSKSLFNFLPTFSPWVLVNF